MATVSLCIAVVLAVVGVYCSVTRPSNLVVSCYRCGSIGKLVTKCDDVVFRFCPLCGERKLYEGDNHYTQPHFPEFGYLCPRHGCLTRPISASEVMCLQDGEIFPVSTRSYGPKNGKSIDDGARGLGPSDAERAPPEARGSSVPPEGET